MPKLIYQEDDALIHGRDLDYRGIHEWWEHQFPGRIFCNDWASAQDIEEDGGDCFTRHILLTVEIGIQKLVTVTFSFEGYCVNSIEDSPVVSTMFNG